MKKLLAALLAAALVFGMNASAFAAQKTLYLSNSELQLEDDVEPYEPDTAPNANGIPGTGC